MRRAIPLTSAPNVLFAVGLFPRGNPKHSSFRTPRQRLSVRVEQCFAAVTERDGRKPVGRNDAQRKILAIDPSLWAEDQYDIGSIIFSIFNRGL